MKRCAVSLPVPDGQSPLERRIAMQRLAERINGMHPDTVVERVGVMQIIVQVPDDLVLVIRQSLGCFVDDTLPKP